MAVTVVLMWLAILVAKAKRWNQIARYSLIAFIALAQVIIVMLDLYTMTDPSLKIVK